MSTHRSPNAGTFHPDMIAVTRNRFTNQFLAAADGLGLECRPLHADRRTWLITGNGRRLTVRAAILGCNNRLAVRFSSNKYLTHVRMQFHGIPMPGFSRFVAYETDGWDIARREASAFACDRYPVVAKAVSGSGALNVYVNIENEVELDWALGMLRSAGVEDFLVESQLTGRLYRIQVFDGDIVGVVHKHPGIVVGDGVSTIRELVRADDSARAAGGQGPLVFGSQVLRHLAKSGREPDSVLSCGAIQVLAGEISGRLGCRIEPLAVDRVPARARALFRRAAAASGLRWVGLDYFCDDIMDPEVAHSGAFNEVNSAPVPRDFEPGMTRDHYLGKATLILSRYFDIARTGEAAA